MGVNKLILEESEKAFLDESARREALTSKAEKYISAVVIVIGFGVIELEPLKQYELGKQIGAPLFCYTFWSVLAFILLGASLILAFMSMQVRKYVTYPSGQTLFEHLKGKDESDAKLIMATTYLEIRDKNAKLNTNRAHLLFYSGLLLIIGFVVVIITHLIWKLAI